MRCRKCGQDKEETEFYKRKDKLYASCKVCSYKSKSTNSMTVIVTTAGTGGAKTTTYTKVANYFFEKKFFRMEDHDNIYYIPLLIITKIEVKKNAQPVNTRPSNNTIYV